MLYQNIEIVKRIQGNKLLEYFKWKLKNESYDINEIKLARYLNISPIEALEIMETLCKENILEVKIKTSCPVCSRSYPIEFTNVNNEINCEDCYGDFIPSDYKRLLTYSYYINLKSPEVIAIIGKPHPRESFVSTMEKGSEKKLSNKKAKVFLSYCHKDEEYKNKLNAHLAPLKRSDKIESWNDRELRAGSCFDDEIKMHLNEDDIIILLVSSDFIQSDYCYEVEMQKALERMKNKDVILVAVIIRPCLWQETPLKDIQVVPKDGLPISSHENEDEGYLYVVNSIKQLLDTL